MSRVSKTSQWKWNLWMSALLTESPEADLILYECSVGSSHTGCTLSFPVPTTGEIFHQVSTSYLLMEELSGKCRGERSVFWRWRHDRDWCVTTSRDVLCRFSILRNASSFSPAEKENLTVRSEGIYLMPQWFHVDNKDLCSMAFHLWSLRVRETTAEGFEKGG